MLKDQFACTITMKLNLFQIFKLLLSFSTKSLSINLSVFTHFVELIVP